MTKKTLKIEDLGGGTYNQTTKKIIKLESGVKRIVVRKESKFPNGSLVNEIKFLLSLSPEAKLHFPQVEQYRIDEVPIFYEMPYYNLKSLRRNIMGGNIDSRYCIKVIQNILDFTFVDIFSQNIQVNTLSNLLKENFLRVNQRHNQLCNKSDIIKRFIKAKSFVVGGEKYRNISEIINWFMERPKIMKKLMPKCTHMVHGDFHFDNFLIDDKNPNKFILIDPRGEKGGYDYAYDLGKLWHSFHGLYDFIHGGLFEMEYKVNGSLVEVEVFRPRKSKALEVYREIYNKRGKFIDMCIQHTKEDNVEEQILFSEAIHFCALAPFHLKNDGIEKLALCRYIMGVKLLNEFIHRIK